LGLITLFCLLDRWQAIWRNAFKKEAQCPNVVFQAAPYTASLTLLAGSGFSQTLKENLEQRSFRLKLEHTSDTIHFRADRYRISVLATLVSHLGVVLLLAGVMLSAVFNWREVVILSPGEPITLAHQRNIHLQSEGFTIEHYPNGSASGYEAEIRLVDSNQEESLGKVRINEPLTYAGVSFFLQGFARTEAGDTITLLAVYDPGYAPIILAGFLLLLGISVTFNFPHCVIYGRIESGSLLRVAGSAERWSTDFEAEFSALVEKFQQGSGQPSGGGEQAC
jgi:cytochrome c biogenesis protein ResB